MPDPRPTFKVRKIVSLDLEVAEGDWEFEVTLDDQACLVFTSGDHLLKARIEDMAAVVDHFKRTILSEPLRGIHSA